MILTATDRYLARLIIVPLVSTLTISAMLLLLDKMVKLFNLVIVAGGPVGVVWKMLVDLLPEYLSLGIPIGLLLGVLLTFRKLAMTSELDTLRGVGLSYTRLLRVPMIYAVVLMGLNVAIVGYLQPQALYGYQQLRFDLGSGALGASIRVGEFTNLGKHMTMRVESSEKEGRLLHGVFVSAEMKGGKTIAVTADHGTFLATDDPNVILLRLANGRLVHNAPDYPRPRVLTFETQDLPVNIPAIQKFRARSDNNELTLPELLKLGASNRAPHKATVAARAEFHYRMVEIVMMLLMPMLAVALAVPPKRSTSGLGIFISIVLVVTYHKVNQYADHMAELGRIHPVIALWTPFLLFSLLIVWMYWTLAYKPGGQPIGMLERAADKVRKAFVRLIRLRGGRDRDPEPVPAE